MSIFNTASMQNHGIVFFHLGRLEFDHLWAISRFEFAHFEISYVNSAKKIENAAPMQKSKKNTKPTT